MIKIRQSSMKSALWIALLGLLSLPAPAQITVAISDFQNRTGKIYLDTWEQQVPEFLKSELSRSPDITLLERRDLKAILDEQTLTMSGLVDTATAQQVGKLLGAQYVITGTITQVASRIRIDAKIISVATGKSVSEKAEAPDTKYLSEMAELLGNNLRFQLTGSGQYRHRRALKKYPTPYFLAGTAVTLAAALIVNNSFHDKQDEYRSAAALEDFDSYYDSANRLNKARYALFTAAGVCAAATLYCWIRNRSPEEVIAAQPPLLPYFSHRNQGEYFLGIRIRF